MKNTSILLLLFSLLLTISCQDDKLGEVDLGQYYGPYIHFTTGSQESVTAGGAFKAVNVRIYSPQWEDFTVNYQLVGSYPQTGTFVVEKGKRSDTLRLTVPANYDITSTVIDTLYLRSATNGVVIGRQNVASANIVKKAIRISAAVAPTI